MNNQPKLLLSYLVILTIISTILIMIAKSLGTSGMAAAGIYMFGPAISAALTYLLFDRSRFKRSGIKLGKLRDYGKYYLLAIILTVVQFIGFSLVGAVNWDFSGQAFLQQMAQMMPGQDIQSTIPAGMNIQTMLVLFALGGLTIFNLTPGILSGFGEEYGWRGLMFPALQTKRPLIGLIIGGTIWFLWHLPLTLLAPLPDANLLINTVQLTASWIATIATHAFLCRAYTESKTIFVPSLAHATLNNAARSFAYFAILNNQVTGNIVVAIVMILAAVWQYKRAQPAK